MIAEAYSEPSRTSNMELFSKKPLTILTKSFILEVGLGSEYPLVYYIQSRFRWKLYFYWTNFNKSQKIYQNSILHTINLDKNTIFDWVFWFDCVLTTDLKWGSWNQKINWLNVFCRKSRKRIEDIKIKKQEERQHITELFHLVSQSE